LKRICASSWTVTKNYCLEVELSKNGLLYKHVADLWRIILRQQLRLTSVNYVERGHCHKQH